MGWASPVGLAMVAAGELIRKAGMVGAARCLGSTPAGCVACRATTAFMMPRCSPRCTCAQSELKTPPLKPPSQLTAGNNFTHMIRTEKRPEHRLVTWGICGWRWCSVVPMLSTEVATSEHVVVPPSSAQRPWGPACRCGPVLPTTQHATIILQPARRLNTSGPHNSLTASDRPLTATPTPAAQTDTSGTQATWAGCCGQLGRKCC